MQELMCAWLCTEIKASKDADNNHSHKMTA